MFEYDHFSDVKTTVTYEETCTQRVMRKTYITYKPKTLKDLWNIWKFGITIGVSAPPEYQFNKQFSQYSGAYLRLVRYGNEWTK